MYDVEQFIDGIWGRFGDGAELVVEDPSEGGPVSRSPIATAADVQTAVKSAREAAPTWAATPAAQRAEALHRVADALAGAADRVAEAQSAEMGKPLAGARAGIAAGVATLRQYAELGPVHRGRALAGDPAAMDLMAYVPRGVVAVLTPWNDPIAVACGLLGAALVTGNTVVHKPSERCPATGALLGRLVADELPDGVFALLTGDGTVGARIAGSDGVDLVAHVGSTASGREIAQAGARTGAKVLRENGGNDALIVDEGVDPRWAAQQAALGALANSGQVCVSVERIYVHSAVAEPFVAALAEHCAGMRLGPARDPYTELGPLVDRRHRDQVHAQVSAALAAGATARCGGHLPEGPGAYYPPTVLTGCTDDMAVMREETFGPVAPVMTVGSFDEALSRAACSAYGLSATVLTRSMSHAQRAWRELPVGTVKVNSVFGGAPGGAAHPRRGSGEGFGYGPELLDEMTVMKVLHLTGPDGPDGRW
ncbi:MULTISPECIES: aldehyde dehydrogenase family protein [unclassified Solwaraspora]|uniref:aldehyde dehydrogenase family protein n=1 Tax=unclassified Solwaraspora TaxID=2627926 RepID=UPI00259BE890|nr:aldehyde dehydrogenase family protein [Solwaraspora sp. WMMA2056]WJK39406.1 aldehyde dehydrogenase family protein [Solwaraspora sp. WMMA2056]